MRYVPEIPPEEGLPNWLYMELRRVSAAIESLVLGSVETFHEEPEVQEDQVVIVHADGTDWNPGAGEGIYAYYDGAWHKLG